MTLYAYNYINGKFVLAGKEPARIGRILLYEQTYDLIVIK